MERVAAHRSRHSDGFGNGAGAGFVRVLIPAAFAFCFASVVSAQIVSVSAPNVKALQAVSKRYWDATMARYPTRATALGDYRFNDKLEDVSKEGRHGWKNTLNRLLREAARVSEVGLNPSQRLTRKLLIRSISDALLELECGLYFTPINPLSGPHIDFPLLHVSQPFANVDDYRAYIARLRAFPHQITDHISNMRAGMARRIVSARIVMEKTLPQIRAHIVRDPRDSEFFAPMRRADVLAPSDRKVIEAAMIDAIESDVVPAYLRLLAFLEDQYLPACRKRVGIGSVPGGLKIYEMLAYLNTTVRLSANDIHETGLREVERIRKRMSGVQTEVHFDGTLDAFLAYMRTDKAQRFTAREQLLAAAKDILQRTKKRLPDLFGRLPRADCVVREIEAFRAASSPVAYYNPSPEDMSRPGYYYINTYAPNERLRFTLEALSYHESVPGHHLQIALDQENTALPKFRRYGTFTAYVEGWALYAEKLGYDIQGYQDPYQRFGQLTFEMWRACRLVVDTGMHVKGWTRQRAIDFMLKNTSLARIDIEAEIDRYISWPGQALAYKIGELRISQLRREAEQGLGDRFDLRSFHDALLGGGAMPIDMLETRMREWIAGQL